MEPDTRYAWPEDGTCPFDRHPLRLAEVGIVRYWDIDVDDNGTFFVWTGETSDDGDDLIPECPHCLATFEVPDLFEWL